MASYTVANQVLHLVIAGSKDELAAAIEKYRNSDLKQWASKEGHRRALSNFVSKQKARCLIHLACVETVATRSSLSIQN